MKTWYMLQSPPQTSVYVWGQVCDSNWQEDAQKPIHSFQDVSYWMISQSNIFYLYSWSCISSVPQNVAGYAHKNTNAPLLEFCTA